MIDTGGVSDLAASEDDLKRFRLLAAVDIIGCGGGLSHIRIVRCASSNLLIVSW